MLQAFVLKGPFMGILKIALLGPPEVEHFDRQLSFHDRKALALLAYLAAEEGIHGRRKLTRLLWPESDMAHGRAALRITLLHLRHILAEVDTTSEQSPHLLTTNDTLGLNLSSGVVLDLQALESIWKLAHNLFAREGVRGELRRALISQLERAAALYRGGFLQDFTLRDTFDFDYWVGMQQGVCYQRIEQVFDWLSQLQRAEGAFEQAIATVERWRSFDPLNEDIYLRLMQLHFATGNRIAALKTYETCVEILMKELSARPSTQLAALAETLRNTPSPLHSRNEAGKHRLSARPLIELPFVGRGVELSRLMTLYEQASRGQPQAVLIEGEAGIGKTRLAATFLDWAKAQGADALEGEALRTFQRLSYQPLQDALGDRLEREHEYALRQLLSETWLAELSRLLPDLRERCRNLPPPTLDEAFAPSRLFEALAHLSQALAARGTLLIFADDIQWIDDATLDVFTYLCKRWTECGTSALLLLNRRRETRGMESRLAEWLMSLRSTVSLTQLHLGNLSAQDTLQVTRSLTNPEEARPVAKEETAFLQPFLHLFQLPGNRLSPEQFGEWLFDETQGQPFYMKTLLQQQLERGLLIPHLVEGRGWAFDPQSADGVHASTLPAEVYAMIQHRLTRLSPATRQLLAAGAVLRHDFTFDELCQVAQLVSQEGLFALDEAIENLFLRESNRQPGRESGVTYQFDHSKLREVVYLEAGDARRQILRGRALQVLEQS